MSAQSLLGVFPLVYRVPLVLGVVHQFGATILVMIATLLTHELRERSRLGS